MMDKNGKKLKTGDIITLDTILGNTILLRVRWDRHYQRWMGEKLEGEPCPQKINGLGHYIEKQE